MNRLAVVIPAYKPSEALLEVVRALSEKAAPAIVIVDDGSGQSYRAIFDSVSQFPNVRLLRHAVNLGKGAALKTGFNFVLCELPEAVGVVTADADGQHHPDDILRVGEALADNPGALVLGSRTFSGDVPLRSRFGNVLTSGVMHALLGQKLQDTQTGLRGISSSLLAKVMRVEATGYEFELHMLIAAHQLGVPVVQVPIQTIYEQGNKSSHFNPIVDSMKIYFVLLRFGSVSALTALLDNLVFFVTWRISAHVLLAQAVARIFATVFNYTMVRSSVFYSHQRHRAVLPKYLALVAASGSVSYWGIQYLHRRAGASPMTAKLLMESVLFLVNFAVQRLVIFRPAEARNGQPEETKQSSGIAPILFALLLAALVGVEVYGFAKTPLFAQSIWDPVGLHRFMRFSGAYITLALPLLMLFPWSFAAVMTGLVLLLTAVAVGPSAILAVAWFLLSANALGGLLLRRGKDAQLLSTLTGAAVYVLLMTLLARQPVHYGMAWAAVLAIPILLDARGMRRRMGQWVSGIRSAELRSGWERAGFAVLVFFLLAHWLVALKPEIGADALAMHLATPMNIAENHRFTFEPARFLWSVMPMGADWLYSIVYILGGQAGGEAAARLTNFALLVLIAGLLYSGLRRFLSPAASWLITASFTATPVVQLVTGSLFSENFLAAAVLGMVLALWRFGDTGERKFLFVAMVLGGTALNVKLGALGFVLLALPFAAVEAARHWKSLGRRPGLVCTLAVVLLLVTALPPYMIAYDKTGDPVFPFLNQTFRSPLIYPPVDFQDARFRQPVNLSLFYGLTFHTSKSYEGQDGSFGFQYLFVIPLAIAGIFWGAQRQAMSAALIGLGAAVMILLLQPNVRYLYPALILLVLPFGALMGRLSSRAPWLYKLLAVLLFGSAALNAYFLPASSFYHKDFCLRSPFSRAERARYVHDAAPSREVIAWFNQHHAGSGVLTTGDESQIAGLNGDIYENHWHQWPVASALRSAHTVQDVLKLITRWNVQYFIAHKKAPGEHARPPALQKVLDVCTAPEYEANYIYLAHLAPDCVMRTSAGNPGEGPSLVVQPGFYDDFHPAILYGGDWSHDEQFEQPDRHTVSYSDIPGVESSLAFQGTAITYTYTKAPNRGIATVTIDGVAQKPLDLYSGSIDWQAHTRFCCFAAGRHTIMIRVSGEMNPKSSGRYVDVDSFVVE